MSEKYHEKEIPEFCGVVTAARNFDTAMVYRKENSPVLVSLGTDPEDGVVCLAISFKGKTIGVSDIVNIIHDKEFLQLAMETDTIVLTRFAKKLLKEYNDLDLSKDGKEDKL